MFGVQKFRMEKAPKQKGDIDCGLFAIAIATALAHFGLDGAVASTSFNQCGMRDHLLMCFENTVYALKKLTFYGRSTPTATGVLRSRLRA